MADQKLLVTINVAREFHGHLGPFLVIGVHMGQAAIKNLNLTAEERHSLRANVQVPLHPPFSCLLDGIQVTTTCTVGNQRLQITNADAIEAVFTAQNRKATITINKTLWQQLQQKQAANQLTEQYAKEIAAMPENHVLIVALQ